MIWIPITPWAFPLEDDEPRDPNETTATHANKTTTTAIGTIFFFMT